MNKRDIKNKKVAEVKTVIIDMIEKTERPPLKTIYIVKMEKIHYLPASCTKRHNTYNLFTFEDLDDARKYLDISYDHIVGQEIKSRNFKLSLDVIKDEVREENGNQIMYERVSRLIGNTDVNNTQTKLYTFTIESINYSLK